MVMDECWLLRLNLSQVVDEGVAQVVNHVVEG